MTASVEPAIAEATREAVDVELDDLGEVVGRERWNTTMSSRRLTNSGLNAWRTSSFTACFRSVPRQGLVDEELAAEVRGEDQDHVPEVDRAALAVGEAAVVEDLQQHVEDLGVRLLDLVEQDHRVRPPPHGLGELPALLVADVAGRGTDQPRHGVLLAVLRHVDAHHRLLVVEQELGERLGELGLADAGRAEEQERSGRPVGVGDAGARAAHGVGDRLHGLLLPDQALAELGLEVQQLLGLALQSSGRPGCRSTRR